LFVCGREPSYVRNRLLIRHLRVHHDVTVVASSRSSYLGRFADVIPRFGMAARHADLVVAGFLGQPLALVAARLLRKPVLLDAMISVFDTFCFDRRVTSPGSLLGRVAFALDHQAVASARLTLVDTGAHAAFFAETFGVPLNHLFVHYIGPDFQLSDEPGGNTHECIVVLHYSSFLPLHGVDIVVQAAATLQSEVRLRFRLVGTGPTRARALLLAERAGVKNVDFVDWQPLEELRRSISHATIALGGHFADNAKARRVIAGKTFQFLAACRPTIVGDNPANREIFEAGVHVEMVPHADPTALADTIRALANDRERRAYLGGTGGALIHQAFEPSQVASELRRAVELALSRSAEQ
jgi:glycosyltransferase involved in cell wall biosynthesis